MMGFPAAANAGPPSGSVGGVAPPALSS